MARPASWPPKLLRHKSGRARAHWGGHDYWFGRYGSQEANERYAAWVRGGPPNGRTTHKKQSPLTVAEALELYDAHARQHYRHLDGRETSEMGYVRAAGSVLLAVCPGMLAEDFRGKALKAVREAMVRKGWCRSNTNAHVNRIKRLWKWLASEELVTAEAYGSVRAVEALKAGRTTAPEAPKVKPVSLEDVEAVIPHLTPHLRAAVRLQLHTACRPGEAVTLDPAEMDRSGAVWLWTPERHKTAYAGKQKVILVGPKAQAVLTPLLVAYAGSGPLLSPAASERLRRDEARAKAPTPRRTPLLVRYVRRPAYTVGGYAQLVARACDAAQVPRWRPGRLRHTAATLFAAEFGWEVTRLLLGHSHVNTTRTYVEDRLGPALDAVLKAG